MVEFVYCTVLGYLVPLCHRFMLLISSEHQYVTCQVTENNVRFVTLLYYDSTSRHCDLSFTMCYDPLTLCLRSGPGSSSVICSVISFSVFSLLSLFCASPISVSSLSLFSVSSLYLSIFRLSAAPQIGCLCQLAQITMWLPNVHI
jgi:hypothetical protein